MSGKKCEIFCGKIVGRKMDTAKLLKVITFFVWTDSD